MCPSSILFFFLCTHSLNNLVLINVQLMFYYIGWSKNKIQIQSGDSNSLYQNVVACSWTLLWSSSREVSTATKEVITRCELVHWSFKFVLCFNSPIPTTFTRWDVIPYPLYIYIHSTAFKVCLFDCIFHFRFTWVSCLTPNLGVHNSS